MRRIAGLVVLLSSVSFGYVRLVMNSNPDIPLRRVDNAAIQFYLNDKVVPGAVAIATDSDPQAAIRAALASWNAVSSANIKFLPLKTTSSGISSSDKQMVIAVAATAGEISTVGGALAVTWWSYTGSGAILDTDIILNPADTFSTTGTKGTYDLQSVMTHELGHALGANHSGLLGASMYPYSYGNTQRYLSADDLAFVTSAYPGTSEPGTISGDVTLAGEPVPFALVVMMDTSSGVTLGALANASGSFSVQAPPGSYLVYAEPFNAFVQPGNFSLSSSQAQAILPFRATFLGGSAGLSAVNVIANNTAKAHISVSSGTSPLRLNYYAFGGAEKSGDVTHVTSFGPIFVHSGQSLDFAFIGTGLDATLTDANFRIYGKGISVRAGSVRQDTSVTFSAGPLMRATLDIAAREDSSLASIFITKGSDTLALSGLLVIVPPTPAFISKSLVSAASYVGSAGDGAVSPGGIYSLFAPTGWPPYLGPANGVGNAGYDAYGRLATDLAGVRVTFDGVPAPLFYVSGGQINLQAPFELDGKQSTQVVVNYFGSVNTAVTVPVLATQPAFFTVYSDGASDSIAVNQDATLNTAANAAARGSFVTIYGTGVGKVSYDIQTGDASPLLPPGYAGSYRVAIGSKSVDAAFGGWTPTAVGLAQWNVQIPADSATGSLPLYVTDTASGAVTQQGTVYVK
jgi:uncharacterized protein (TIGR03437 family)